MPKNAPSRNYVPQKKLVPSRKKDRYAYILVILPMIIRKNEAVETLGNSDNVPSKEIAPHQKASPGIALSSPTDATQAHERSLHCGNSEIRTGYIHTIIPTSSYTSVN